MVKKIYKDEDAIDQPESTEVIVKAAAAAVSEPAASGWREVAIFVCARCGQEKRSQAHRDFVCRPCAES